LAVLIVVQIIPISTFILNIQIDQFKTTFHILNTVTLATYKYIHFKTTFMCSRSIAGVPSSQALPGFLITAPPSVCVPDVIGALAVWIHNLKEKEKKERSKTVRVLDVCPVLFLSCLHWHICICVYLQMHVPLWKPLVLFDSIRSLRTTCMRSSCMTYWVWTGGGVKPCTIWWIEIANCPST